MKRVVVTGIGIVSCLGNNQKEVYESLIKNKSGISFAEAVSYTHLRPTRQASIAKDVF